MTRLIVVALLLSSCMRPQYIRAPRAAMSPEFLYWCMQADEEWPVYGSLGELPDGCQVSRGQWDHLPISVNAEEDLVKETMEAVDAFNRAVGFELFFYSHGNMQPDVAVIVGGDHFWAAAIAKHYAVGGVHRGLIRTFNGLEKLDRADIIMHELGHIVGLKHDPDNRMSIMFPKQSSKAAYLEKKDVDALRYIYRR